MCGIVGIADTTWRGRVKSARPLYEMSREIAHRGPDDEGYVVLENNTYVVYAGPDSSPAVKEKYLSILDREDGHGSNVMFGHRRFSIIDLSTAGHQPMLSADGRYALTFNGEIYNFIEIRQQLEALGRVFRTHSDSEVILEAYCEWGIECFDRFNGMWAVGIYDRVENVLTLCRDRIGKMPMYLWEGDGFVAFASEIKSLLRFLPGSESQVVREELVAAYLIYGLRDLNDHTFYRNIDSLPPATVRQYTATGRIRDTQFWSLPETRRSPSHFGGRKGAIEELEFLLKSSIKLRHVADVPVALELSGGLDSSTIVGMSAEVAEQRFSTYTVKFDNPKWNELPYATEVAKKFNIDHRVISPTTADFWRQLNDLVVSFEEPFHSPNIHTAQNLRRIIAEDGNKVVVTGAGGDELFAGYFEYYPALLRQYWRRGNYLGLAAQVIRMPEGRRVDMRSVRSFLGRLAEPASRRRPTGIYANLGWKNREVIDAVRAMSGPIDSLLVNNMNLLKMPYWLRSGDKYRMAIPIEGRTPFLDYRVIEFAFSLPVSWLIRNGWLKWILRKAVERTLPRNVVWRKEKMGFPFPLTEWLQESRKEIASTLRTLEANPHLDCTVNDVLDLSAKDPHLAWRILSFEMWHKKMIRGEELTCGLQPFS